MSISALAPVDDRLRLERLVAHRELQLVRAYRTGNGRYIQHRQTKLDRARRLLAALPTTTKET